MRRNLWRRFSSTFAMGVVYALTAIALVPLGLVLWFTALKGLPSLAHLAFFINGHRPSVIPGACLSNWIARTAFLVRLASLPALPVRLRHRTYLPRHTRGR